MVLKLHLTHLAWVGAFIAAILFSCSGNGNGEDYEGDSSSSNEGGSNGNSSSSIEGGGNGNSSSSNGNTQNGWPFDNSGEALPQISDTLKKDAANLGLANSIVITYNNGSEPTINNAHEGQVSISKDGENITVNVDVYTNTEYNFVLSGTAKNGSFKIYGELKIGLYLNGVNITNQNGAAINVQNEKKISVYLVGENSLTDGGAYCNNTADTERAKGAFFSEGQLLFSGNGSLGINAKCGHAIVTDDYFRMDYGKITINEAAKDGIHANDAISISGGILKITSEGEGIQNEKEAFPIEIKGGKVAIKTTGIKSHGISSIGTTTISNGIVQISVEGDGSKGISSTVSINISGGTIAIKASGSRYTDNSVSPPDESNAAGIKADQDLIISGGKLTIESPGSKAKGINVDGNINMSDGNVSVKADDDGIKVTGNLTVSGGSVYSESKNKDGIDCDGQYSKTGGTVDVKDANSGGF